MKKIVSIAVLLLFWTGSALVMAQEEKYPEMTFVETSHNFGLFDIEHGDQICWFVFTNTGNKDLFILDATSTCGCTVPEYPKTPISPGMTDSIKVSYKGSTKRPGVFKKTISLRTNCKVNSTYLYIGGEMVEKLVEDRIAKKED